MEINVLIESADTGAERVADSLAGRLMSYRVLDIDTTMLDDAESITAFINAKDFTARRAGI